MKILSIHDGHNASAAIFEDGKILACVSEERLNRIKFYWGWPKLSLDRVFSDTGLKLKDIDAITVSHLSALGYAKRKFFTFENYTWKPKIMLGHFYNIYEATRREIKIRRFAQGKKIFFCDHHLAHSASAYYFSGFEDALVVSIDWLGDSLSHIAYDVRGGQWEFLVSGGTRESLGAFYAALTEGLGFKPNRHEGKIVGLAAFGKSAEIEKKEKDPIVKIQSDKLHFERKDYLPMLEKIKEMEKNYGREDVSAYGQEKLEEIVVSHITKLCEMTGRKNVALAGGIFANVKLNQRIKENCPVDKIFIQPAMGDEGLVLGSAAYYLSKNSGQKFGPIENVYFGPVYSDQEIEDILREGKYQFEISDNAAKLAADLIDKGKIIGWFDGKMEFGPRALGCRSILGDPRNKDINDILNKRLRRSEFMPFAPSALYEKAAEVFEKTEGCLHTAEFMTITFPVKKEWREKIPAVAHVDGTARPQLVKKEVNPNYHYLISEFFELTGIPLLINTSFNMHEEPIVASPQDALRSFDSGAVDYLIFNNKFILKK